MSNPICIEQEVCIADLTGEDLYPYTPEELIDASQLESPLDWKEVTA